MNEPATDLTAFLRDRLDEAQADAQRFITDDDPNWSRPDWLTGNHLLADIESKRRIIGNCEEVINGTGWPGLAYIVLRLLALPHADHPCYDPRWRM